MDFLSLATISYIIHLSLVGHLKYGTNVDTCNLSGCGCGLVNNIEFDDSLEALNAAVTFLTAEIDLPRQCHLVSNPRSQGSLSKTYHDLVTLDIPIDNGEGSSVAGELPA